MPTYDYRCKTCGGRFEVFQSIKDDALTTCPGSSCVSEVAEQRGTGEISRIVTGGAGIVFKGDGFYLTDYARKGKGGGEDEETKTKPSTSTETKDGSAADSGEAKSESKTDTNDK